MRLPSLRGTLHALHVSADGRKLWAVGDRGLIVHSNDGGVTLVQQNPRVAAPESSRVQTAGGLLKAAWAGIDPKQTSQQVPPLEGLEVKPSQSPAQSGLNGADSKKPSPKVARKPAPVTRPTAQTLTKPATKEAVRPASKPSVTVPVPSLADAPMDPFQAQFSGVFFIDDFTGWAVGQAGTILATRDGGRNWTPQTSGVRTWLHDVYFVDDRTGWVVGEAGTLLTTRDGGQTWIRQTSGVGHQLKAVRFIDDRNGWVLGTNGVVLVTQDGGLTWTQQDGSRTPLYAFHFLDAQTGWAVGLGGTILATRDGGQSWQPQASGVSAPLLAVYFVDGRMGWAVGELGTILGTRDGGQSWQPQTSGTQAGIYDVCFVDTKRGWAVGAFGSVLATHDGGRSWQPLTLGARSKLRGLYFIDRSRGWAVGLGGVILATGDGGMTWTPQASGTQDWLLSVYFTDALTGWAVGTEGALLHTRDGGRRWDKQESGTSAWLYAVHFLDTRRGWVVGMGGTLLSTQDGGRSWSRRTGMAPSTLTDIRFVDARNGWAVGVFGTLLASRDGGGSWQAQISGTNVGLFTVYFADTNTGWVAGETGTLLATIDGGQRWAPQKSGTDQSLLDLHFVDALNGWAVGEAGTLLSTADGGSNWTSQRSGTRETLATVHFADDKTGWVVGDAGTILTTRDGGRTWLTPRYRIYPAPWTYLAMLLGAASLLLALRPTHAAQASEPTQGIAGLFVSDAPLDPEAQDRLGHHALADGLANYLRNRNTEPSLTLAVTGSWGSGKTSVMLRLKHQLQHAGFHPAWFNAWHHQQEGRQLASMLNAIRRQAVPPLYKPSGLRVRAHLYWQRGWFYQLLFLVLLALVGLGVRDLWNTPNRWGLLIAEVRATFAGMRPVVITPAGLEKLRKEGVVEQDVLRAIDDNLLWLPHPDKDHTCRVEGGDCRFENLEQLYLTLEELLKRPGGTVELTDEEKQAIAGAVRHLGVGPVTLFGVLLAGVMLPLLLGKGLAVYGFQYLDLVKRLLPQPGQPEGKEAVGTIERFRVEFCRLTTALDGRLVLLIDDLDRCTCETVREVLELVNYLTSVGKCFTVLGMAMEHVLVCIPPRNGTGDDYARQYLRKLINIEVPVPRLDLEKSRQLLQTRAGETARPAGRQRLHTWTVILLALITVIPLAWLMQAGWKWLYPSPTHKPLITESSRSPPSAQLAPAVPSSAGTVLDAAVTKKDVELVGLIPAQPDDRGSLAAWLAVLGSCLILAAAARFSRRHWLEWLRTRGWIKTLRISLGGAERTQDSPAFEQALRVWHDVFAYGDPTPRGIKRFINRVRFLAMLEAAQPPEQRIPESLLVALTALHHAYKTLPPQLAGLTESAKWSVFFRDDNQNELDQLTLTALHEYKEANPHAWPPTEMQYQRFLNLVQNIHIH